MLLVLQVLAACGGDGSPEGGGGSVVSTAEGDEDHGRAGNEASLSARPRAPVGEPLPTGASVVEGSGPRAGLVHVPDGLPAGEASPLVVMFHGAGGSSEQSLDLVRAQADEVGFVVLAPSSAAATWDVIAGGWGPDVRSVDRSLDEVFQRIAIDPARVVAAGFSDGASYALSLGIANGGLFSRIVALSPGFAAPPGREGSPSVFVSHGTADPVLPIDRTSRRVVPSLRQSGYEVRYVEFDGGHVVPADVLVAAFEGLTSRG